MSRSRDLANLADEATGGLVKADIGLGNVDNTADSAKPVSTAQQTEIDKLAYQGEPHIIPDVLYPAYVASGTSPKLLDGTTTHGTGTYNGTAVSTDYGTVQADGRKYYYTNIAGSKPIKDPRIGGHFGSQRYRFSSSQLLEQETATQGSNVHSVDGREWIRRVGNEWTDINNSAGDWAYVLNSATENSNFIEITGYFNAVNWLALTDTANDVNISIDGVANSSTFTGGTPSVNSPLTGRFVNAHSVVALAFDSTPNLGIHTLKLSNVNGDYMRTYGIELIAQDTSNRNNIQIPSQNVVSYGKKFTVSGTPHYNPFNNQTIGDTTSHGKNTVGWTTYDSTLDTATSLGLDAWVDSGNYYRPVNGGRVVKWVDSSGNIKTSVNMMPPSAKAIGSHSGNSGPHQTAWTSTYQPVFSSGSIDHSQAEVAKTFYFREFGNGSANGGTNATYADASMLEAAADNVAYVMDDGLTSFSGEEQRGSGDQVYSDSRTWYMTFIGTGLTLKHNDLSGRSANVSVDGVSIHSGTYSSNPDYNKVQNLPYGTHVVKYEGTSTYHAFSEAIFHQPKKPPIPEDSVILADYMLMADFVPQTSGDLPHISKGVRYCSASRDSFIDGNSATSTKFFQNVASGTGGFQISLNQNGYTLSEGRIVGFGHSFGVNFMRDTDRMTDVQAHLDGNPYTYNSSDIWDTDTVWDDTNGDGTLTKSGSTAQEVYGIKNQTLGLHTFGDKTTSDPNASKFNDWIGWQIATPIHTSSHYQTFETPFLHELVGGDRNMEQTNLICTPDRKTWDEVTRDTSYLGKSVLLTSTDTQSTSSSTTQIFDDWRGIYSNTGKYFFNKDFAIAYDRIICLKDGQYKIEGQTIRTITNDHVKIKINGVITARGHAGSSDYDTITVSLNIPIKRGDYIQIQGGWYQDQTYSQLQISRI